MIKPVQHACLIVLTISLAGCEFVLPTPTARDDRPVVASRDAPSERTSRTVTRQAPAGSTSETPWLVDRADQVGTLYFWMNVGAANGHELALLPKLVERGWRAHAEIHAKHVRAFGAPGGVVVSNPCGQPTRPEDGKHKTYMAMRFDQRSMADQAGFDRICDAGELRDAMRTLQAATPGRVWVYLGTPRDERLTDAQILEAVRPFEEAGCSIVIDAAGVEMTSGHPNRGKGSLVGPASWDVAQLLTSRGIPVGYEPRPVEGSPWPGSGFPCFAVAYETTKEGRRVPSGFFRSDPVRFKTNKVATDRLDDLILLVNDRSSDEWIVELLSRGYDVAAAPYSRIRRGVDATTLIERARAARAARR